MDCPLARKELSGIGSCSIHWENHSRTGVKKNELAPHQKKQWVIPPKENADFVAQMEEVLDAYEQPYESNIPLVCFDEKPLQILCEVQAPLPPAPGVPEKQDYEYKREGTACILGFFEPLSGQRSFSIKDRRTMQDFAHEMKRLVDELYPQAAG